jgi:hypothetical protein
MKAHENEEEEEEEHGEAVVWWWWVLVGDGDGGGSWVGGDENHDDVRWWRWWSAHANELVMRGVVIVEVEVLDALAPWSWRCKDTEVSSYKRVVKIVMPGWQCAIQVWNDVLSVACA